MPDAHPVTQQTLPALKGTLAIIEYKTKIN